MNNTAFRVLCFIYIVIMFHAIVAFKKSLYQIDFIARPITNPNSGHTIVSVEVVIFPFSV